MEQELSIVMKHVREIYDKDALVAKDRDGTACLLPIRKIAYLSRTKHGSVVHLITESPQSAGEYVVREHLDEMFARLKTSGFEQPHNSYIVNIRHLKNIGDKELVLKNGVILSVARSKYQHFVEAFLRYWGGKYFLQMRLKERWKIFACIGAAEILIFAVNRLRIPGLNLITAVLIYTELCLLLCCGRVGKKVFLTLSKS